MLRRLLLLVLLTVLLGGCRRVSLPTPAASPVLLGRTCHEERLEAAKRFRLEHCGTVTRLTVSQPWRGARDVFRYLLVPRTDTALLRAARRLERVPDVTVIAVPVQRVVTLSTPYLAEFEALGRLDRVVAVGSAPLVWSPALHERLKRGLVMDLGGNGMKIAKRLESLLMLRPDAILATGSGVSAYDQNFAWREMGLPVVVAAEWMEETPLGRAEWIRFTGALTGDDARALAFYRGIAGRYRAVRAAAARRPGPRPTVFGGAPWGGVWYQQGGGSFMAAFLRDAGADYLWRELPGPGGVPVGTEEVMLRAWNADVWLNPSMVRSLGELVMQDPGFHAFRALRLGHVYASDRRTNSGGGNDYWESGVSRPDLVLADLMRTLHPVSGDTNMFYYRHLEKKP